MVAGIDTLFEAYAPDRLPFPATELYNESWLLRLILDWFSRNKVGEHPLAFPDRARWYSEAWLPTAFSSREVPRRLAESWTHADGAIGHFTIGQRGKCTLSLLSDAEHLVVLEAKLFSDLSSGVKNATYFDQAARTVACMTEVLHEATRRPSSMSHLGFYLLAPQSQIDAKRYASEMDRDSIWRKVKQRIAAYSGTKDEWYEIWFQPTFRRTTIDVISWEQLLGTIGEYDSSSAMSIDEFYRRCVTVNR